MTLRLSIVAIGILCVSNALLASDGALQFDRNELSFGKIDRNNGIDHVIILRGRNVSSVAINIGRINIGCGCVSAVLKSPPTVAAGAEVIVEVSLRMHDIRIGGHKYKLTVLDDNDEALGGVSVTYNYVPRVIATPTEINLVPTTPATYEGVATLSLADGLRPTDLRLAPTKASLKVASEPTGESQILLHVSLDAASGSNPGVLNESVNVFASNLADPDFIIPIRGEIIAPVTASPDILLVAKDNRIHEITLHSSRPSMFRTLPRLETSK